MWMLLREPEISELHLMCPSGPEPSYPQCILRERMHLSQYLTWETAISLSPKANSSSGSRRVKTWFTDVRRTSPVSTSGSQPRLLCVSMAGVGVRRRAIRVSRAIGRCPLPRRRPSRIGRGEMLYAKCPRTSTMGQNVRIDVLMERCSDLRFMYGAIAWQEANRSND